METPAFLRLSRSSPNKMSERAKIDRKSDEEAAIYNCVTCEWHVKKVESAVLAVQKETSVLRSLLKFTQSAMMARQD